MLPLNERINNKCTLQSEKDPTSPSLLIKRPVITDISMMPKMMTLKLTKPQTPVSTGSKQCLTTVPLNTVLNQSDSSRIQSHQAVFHETPSITVPITNSTHISTIVPSMNVESDDENENSFNKDGYFIWDHKTIMLFFTEYEYHEKKLQNRKYKSKEAMFSALAESFKKKGYVNANKNNMKNKFKLLKKNWDKYIKRTMGKNSSEKGMKPLPYENEMIRIFGKSHSAAPLFVVGRNESVSQEEILQRVSQHSSDNENEEQRQISIPSHSLPLTPTVNSESESITDSRSSMMNSSCSSLINTKPKVRDGKLALTLQSIKESICTVLQKESDDKQEARTKFLTELQKCNELQKERNNILQKQLEILERMANKIYPVQKEIELSDVELD